MIKIFSVCTVECLLGATCTFNLTIALKDIWSFCSFHINFIFKILSCKTAFRYSTNSNLNQSMASDWKIISKVLCFVYKNMKRFYLNVHIRRPFGRAIFCWISIESMKKRLHSERLHLSYICNQTFFCFQRLASNCMTINF